MLLCENKSISLHFDIDMIRNMNHVKAFAEFKKLSKCVKYWIHQ